MSLVVLNHLGIATFSGGFIGVDVFFVISGYLITSILSRQIGSGSFSIANFYRKRAFRILPALYVLLIAVLVAGYFILMPDDYSELAEATGSAIVFGSNVFFAVTTGGYFSVNSADVPLLHIWSLSLEEQFYFLWPLALVFLQRAPRGSRLFIIGLVAVLSFVGAEVGARRGWSGGYYLLHARAGELLVGCFLATLRLERDAGNKPKLSFALATAGAMLIAAPSVLLTPESTFPGLNAIPPCVGAALLILAPAYGRNVVTGILSTRPFVAIGLISYSLYLYHWPVISFLHYRRVNLTPLIAGAVIAATLVMAYLSWRFVETPFRHRRANPRNVLLAAATLAVTVMVTPVFVYGMDGMPGRFPYTTMSQAQLNRERARYWQLVGTTDTQFDPSPGARNLLIIGNSHAYDLSYALTQNGFKGNIHLASTGGDCFNFGHNPREPRFAKECKGYEEAMLNGGQLHRASVVYMHDSWAGVDVTGLMNVIHEVRARTQAPIVVFGPTMIFSEAPLVIRGEAAAAGKTSPSDVNAFARGDAHGDRIHLDHDLAAWFAGVNLPGVTYVSAMDVQCGSAHECPIVGDDGSYLYFDNNHFTLQGSRRFGRRLKAAYPMLF